MEYTQVYEFMANPLGYKKLEEEKHDTVKQDYIKTESDSVSINENEEKDYKIIGIIICGFICMIIVSYILKYHFP